MRECVRERIASRENQFRTARGAIGRSGAGRRTAEQSGSGLRAADSRTQSPFSPMHLPLLRLATVFVVVAATLAAKITSPKEHFGFAIGDDYHLATYTQTEAYFKKVAAESNRVRL